MLQTSSCYNLVKSTEERAIAYRWIPALGFLRLSYSEISGHYTETQRAVYWEI